MEPDTTIELRGQIAGRNHLDRRYNLKNLDETLRKRSKIEKIRMAKLPRNTVHAPNNILKKDGSQNTLFGLLFEGNQNCCLTETAPQAAPAPSVSKPEPEVHKTVDMFEDDQELKEQAASPVSRKKKKSGKPS